MRIRERWSVKQCSGIQWVKRNIGTRQCQKEKENYIKYEASIDGGHRINYDNKG